MLKVLFIHKAFFLSKGIVSKLGPRKCDVGNIHHGKEHTNSPIDVHICLDVANKHYANYYHHW